MALVKPFGILVEPWGEGIIAVIARHRASLEDQNLTAEGGCAPRLSLNRGSTLRQSGMTWDDRGGGRGPKNRLIGTSGHRMIR